MWVPVVITFILVALCLTSHARDATFAGQYSDPNHPGCARSIRFETKTSAMVFGADAAGGEGVACDGQTDTKWGPLPAKLNGIEIVVDFSSKGGPSDLAGKYDEVSAAINWQDGNAWTKLQ